MGTPVCRATSTESSRLGAWTSSTTSSQAMRRLAAERLTVRTPAMTFEADVTAHAIVREGQWRPLHFDFAGSEVSLRHARAAVRSLSFIMPSLDARTRDLVVGMTGVSGSVSAHTPYVELPSAKALASLVTLPLDVAIDGGQVSASVQVDVDLAPLAFTGRARVEARRLRGRVGAGKMDGELMAALQATQHGRVTDSVGEPGRVQEHRRSRDARLVGEGPPGRRGGPHPS